MIRVIALAAAIVGILTLQADAYFRWPWAPHYRHHHNVASPDTVPDCAEINAAVKNMTPERYERALRQTTKEQQKIIADCAVPP